MTFSAEANLPRNALLTRLTLARLTLARSTMACLTMACLLSTGWEDRLCADEPGQQPPNPSAETSADHEPIRLLVLPRGGPIRIDVVVDLGEKSVQQRWADGAQALFKKLDRDNDQQLTGEEFRQAPWVRVTNGAAIRRGVVGEFFGGVFGKMREKEDEKRYDFAKFEQEMRAERPPFRVLGTVQPEKGRELFEWVDVDGDQELSRAELEHVDRAVAKLDTNLDRVLSAAEVKQFINPNYSIARPTPNQSMPVKLMHVLGESNYALAMQMISQYGEAEQSVAISILSDKTLVHDDDQDGRLNVDELQSWLAESPADLTLRVTPKAQDAANSQLEVVESESSEYTVSTDGRTQASFAGRGAIFETDWQLWQNNRYSSFLEQNFMYADGDNNDYIDSKEAARSIYNTIFRELDADDDGMVFLKEVKAFTATLSSGAQGISFALHEKGQSLFAMLDENFDQAISPREAARAIQLLERFDADGNGVIAQDELLPTYSISVDYSAPEGISNYFQTTIADGRRGYQTSAAAGWISLLDVNQDGEVSRFEFPFSKEKFLALDTNQDGVITSDEAAPAQP